MADDDASPVGVSVARTAVALLPPVTLIVGLLYYFGWAHHQALAYWLGESISAYAYSTTDYVLGSVASLVFALLALSFLALFALLLHQRVRRQLLEGDRGWARLASTILIVAGLLLIAYGLVFVWWPPEAGSSNDWLEGAFEITSPLSFGLAAVLIAYGGWLRSQAGSGKEPRQPSWHRAFAAAMIMSIVALSLFWAVGNFAAVRGKADAEAVVDQACFHRLPAVTVYAPRDLGLDPIFPKTAVGTPGSQYVVRYDGLYLLDHVAGVWFLVPDDLELNTRLVMLRDDAGLRFELNYEERDTGCPRDVSASA